ncbi:MAG: mechanosensitive ion channel [Kofleriaceae bacterium]
MLDDLLDYLQRPFVVLSGTPVTALSILTGLAIVIAARIVGSLAARGTQRALARHGTDESVQFSIGKILRYVITVAGVLVAISTVGVNMSAVLAASAVLLVGIGFGLQTVAENFISGLILLVERPVGKGDFVRVGDTLGTVEDVGLRASKLVTRDGVTMIIPNSRLVSDAVENLTVPTQAVRISVDVGVAYGSDLEVVRAALLEVAAASDHVLAAPAPMVLMRGFGDSSLDVSLVVWIADARTDLIVASELRFAIDATFRRRDVTIPFPQRDLWVKTLPPAGGDGARA